ncbi:hypothetical protein R5R35_010988 [Gryllus longicercus]|uniref:Uncharacterized protein n=1 Tax=Gryllus longicercus TaxID=2509291 RepID=A0AAN9YYK6_9ORTH
MRARPVLAPALALASLLCVSWPCESAYLAHAPPVVATPWRKALLPCECAAAAAATLDCSERGLAALDEAALRVARRCGRVAALALAGNRLEALPDALGDVRVVNASRNRLRQLPRPGQVSAQATLLDFSDNRLSSPGDDALRHLPALRTLRLSRNRSLRHLRFLPDPCGLVHLEAGENGVASLDGPLARCARLETLDLSGNALAAAPRHVLASLRRLRVLDLSWNDVAPFPLDTFAGLTQLTELRLDSTGAEALPEGIFADLPQLEFGA